MALRFRLHAEPPASPFEPIPFEEGGEAELVESTGEQAALATEVPAPPGSSLRAECIENGRTYTLKVRSCRRAGERRFLVRGRWVSLTRADREFLRATAGAPRGPSSAT